MSTLLLANSRAVTTNQNGLHDKLEDIVQRNLSCESQKPFSQHTLNAFEQAQQWLGNWQGEIILDACCGVGESTAWLANEYPHAKVIGVDKSAVRTNRHHLHAKDRQNVMVVRGDLNDFWRLAIRAKWQLSQHYLLYPNPYPKAAQIKKRWYASPALRSILALGGAFTVRSNWRLYIEEFAYALDIAGYKADINLYKPDTAITPFERKYSASGQQCWQLQCLLTD